MSKHSFDCSIAEQVGINAAILYQNIKWWCEKNAANQKNIYDGRVWSYNSITAFEELFPYLTKKQIRTALDKLREADLIVTGNYNEDPRDRTIWYALSGKLHMPSGADTYAPEGRPLPDSKPDNKQTIEKNLFQEPLHSQQKDYTDNQFDRFWKNYPKKTGKPAAKKAFLKAIKKADPELIIDRAANYSKWLKSGGPSDFRPTPKHPQGWLNDERWNDEEISGAAKPPQKQTYAQRILQQYGTQQ